MYAHEDTPAAIQEKLAALPWGVLEDTPTDLLRRYAGQVTALESQSIVLDEQVVARAAAKYGRAVAHVVHRYPDEALVGLLDEAPTRQVVHVTFGSVLESFGSELKAVLQSHQDVYEQVLDQHFYRHLLPFTKSSRK